MRDLAVLFLQSFSKTVANLRPSDRVIAGLCALFMRPGFIGGLP